MDFDLTRYLVDKICGVVEIDCPSFAAAKAIRANLSLIKLLVDEVDEQEDRFRLKVQGDIVTPEFTLKPPTSRQHKLDFERLLNLVQDSDKPVCIVDHATHHCILMGSNFTPDRLIWHPSAYHGMNFLQLWQNSLDRLDDLTRQLRQDGRADNFGYILDRVDGSRAFYVKSYFIGDWMGRPVRVSIGIDWRPLEVPVML